MQLIAFIAEARVAKRILDHLRMDSTGPPVARAQDVGLPPGPIRLGFVLDLEQAWIQAAQQEPATLDMRQLYPLGGEDAL
jgi:hypothetical protein